VNTRPRSSLGLIDEEYPSLKKMNIEAYKNDLIVDKNTKLVN
jgi:hypothetical protein